MIRLLSALVASALLLSSLSATAQQSATGTKIVVGVVEAPTFAIKDPDGGWGGIAVPMDGGR